MVDLRCGFPNIVFTVEDLSAQTDHIYCRWRAKGTHTGAFWELPASGREVEIGALVISRFMGERIVDQWNYWDVSSPFFQLLLASTRRAAAL